MKREAEVGAGGGEGRKENRRERGREREMRKGGTCLSFSPELDTLFSLSLAERKVAKKKKKRCVLVTQRWPCIVG